jgi:hydrogenase expression/formation protein HypC
VPRYPWKNISIDKDNITIIDISGARREDISIGDTVICHASYALHKIDEALALEKLDFLKEIIENEIY